MRLAVFASGRGSNFRAIVDHVRLNVLKDVQVGLLVTNDANAPAVTFAKENSIPFMFIEGVLGRRFPTKEDREKARNEFDARAVEVLNQRGIDLVALAGFMQVIGPALVESHKMRIMNIHPAKDLVRFGGRGMYGERVHEAVLRSGVKESGCTIHYVDDTIDGGPIILQSTVSVEPGDSPETLAHRILIQEHRTYSKAIQLHVDGRAKVVGGKALIDWSSNWENEWNDRQQAFIEYQTEQSKKQERMLQSSG